MADRALPRAVHVAQRITVRPECSLNHFSRWSTFSSTGSQGGSSGRVGACGMSMVAKEQIDTEGHGNSGGTRRNNLHAPRDRYRRWTPSDMKMRPLVVTGPTTSWQVRLTRRCMPPPTCLTAMGVGCSWCCNMSRLLYMYPAMDSWDPASATVMVDHLARRLKPLQQARMPLCPYSRLH